MILKGTQTEMNLLKAFAGESIARNKYMSYADRAKKDGFISIQNVFNETAEHELSHAKTFFKFLEGGNVEIQAKLGSFSISETVVNLKNSIEGEHEECSNLYPKYRRIAEEEGFKKIASLFKVIGEVEKRHEIRFTQLFELLDSNTFFRRNTPIEWKCLKCGYVHYSKTAFEMCPACNHPQAYFEPIEAGY